MKRLSIIAVVVFCYSSAVACLKPEVFIIENTESEPDTKIPFGIVELESQDSIQHWGVAHRLGVPKPYIYEAWPLGSFYDENDRTFNIISNYRRGHAVFTAGSIKCIKLNKKGELINETTVCSSDMGSAYCIGGVVAGNGDYILAVGIRRDSTAYRNLILRSEDCGYTWNEYDFVVDNNPVKISSGTQSGTFFRTKENRLLCFSYNINGKKQPSILVSSDNGISWLSKPIINGQEGFMEGQFVEIEGSVYCIIRHVHDTFCYLICSNDDGQTWSAPLKLNRMNTGNGIAIMYYEKSKAIELTWVDRNLYQLDNTTERYPMMRSLLSVSDFITGNIHKGMPIVFMDATLGMDCGYQRTLLSEDGVTLLVYYDKDNEDDGCCIKYVISHREL